MTPTATTPHAVVSPEQWLEARTALLAEEKELTYRRDDLARRRRELPWVKVTSPYVFDGPHGPETLSRLFDGRSQLIVYHFMLGPGWGEGCKSCSFLADHFDGSLVHLRQRDVSFAAVSRAPWAEIAPFQQRMAWRFPWVSSFANTFNKDFHVSFSPEEVASGRLNYNYRIGQFPSEEAPGVSVFYKNDAGEIFHTYSAFARGCDILVGAYNLLDLTPKGRDEDALAFSMSWVQFHDQYAEAQFQQAPAADSCCTAGGEHRA